MTPLNENEPGLKSQRYYEQTRDGKLILRRMMERYVPLEVTQQKKQGFSAPDASWFRGESLQYIQELLLQPSALIYDYFQRDLVRQMIDEPVSGQVNRRLLLWSFLCFEWWLKLFREGESHA